MCSLLSGNVKPPRLIKRFRGPVLHLLIQSSQQPLDADTTFHLHRKGGGHSLSPKPNSPQAARCLSSFSVPSRISPLSWAISSRISVLEFYHFLFKLIYQPKLSAELNTNVYEQINGRLFQLKWRREAPQSNILESRWD